MARVSGASHLLAQNLPQPTTPRTELAQILTGHEGLSGSVRCGQAGPRRRSESSSTIRERRDSSATEPLFLKHVAMDCQSKECIRCDGREQQRYEWRSPIRDKEEKLLLNIPLYSTQLPLPRKKLSRLYKLSQNGLQVYQVANVKAEWNLVMTFPDLSGTGKVTSVKFGADAKYVAVGSMDHNLRIFGLPRDEQMEEAKSADHGNKMIQGDAEDVSSTLNMVMVRVREFPVFFSRRW